MARMWKDQSFKRNLEGIMVRLKQYLINSEDPVAEDVDENVQKN